jgi:hypothetical protein
MQIRLLDHDHLQFGPVTVDLANQHILSLFCRLFAADHAADPGRHRPPPRFSCH